MTDRELMQMALDALNRSDYLGWQLNIPIIKALRARLAQPEQYPENFIDALRFDTALREPEPVAWMYQHEDTGLTMCVIVQQVGAGFEKNNPRWKKITPLYTTPPQREWQGLTDEEITSLVREAARGSAINRDGSTSQRIARAIEAKLKEKNT